MQKFTCENNMKKIFLGTFIAFLVLSCNEKSGNTAQGIYENYLFKSNISNSDAIVINLYNSKKNETRSQVYDSVPLKKIFKIDKPDEIENFSNLFDNAEQTDYCCCPKPIYTISLLQRGKQLEMYYLDTIEFKNKVRIYERSFQYSYIIEKQKWKTFLAK